MKKTLLFFEKDTKIESIQKNELKNSEVFSFDIQAHKLLEKNSIEHTIAETYLSKEDHEEIFRTTISFWDWHKNDSFSEFLNFNEISLLGILDSNELHQILVREIYAYFTIKRIIEKESPEKIICSNHFSKMINSITNHKTQLLIFDESEHDFLVVWDKLLLRFTIGKIPISIPISRKTYTTIKNFVESTIGSLNGLWFKSKNKNDTILFVEFNPIQYVELLKYLQDYPGNLVFLNRRRSAMWNMSAIKTLKEYNCKMITPHKFMSKKEKKQASKLSEQYSKELDTLWSNNEIFEKIFSIDGKSFWNSISDVLLRTYKSRLLEYVELAMFSQKFLETVNVKCILSLNVLGETEKSILDKNNNQIMSILLEHAGTNYVPEISMYDISNMYSLFKDKIALWGNIQRNYLTDVHKIPDDRILTIGSTRHDSFFKRKMSQKSSSEKIILLTPQVVQEYNAQTDTNTYLRLEKLLKKLFSIIDNLSDVKLIVKMHPTIDPGNEFVKKLIHRLNPDVKIYQLEPILDVVESCDIMININTEFFPSTVIYEGLILNKPILNIYTMDDYYDFQFTKDCGLLSISDHDDVEKPLNQMLHDEHFCNELIKNGQNHLKNYFTNPGAASQTFAEFLKNI